MELASITSDAENFYASSILTENQFAYIGFNDFENENSFVWTDGSVTDYVRWSNNEPNNHSGAEHCVAIYPS